MVAYVDEQARFALLDDLGDLTFIRVVAECATELPCLPVVVTEDDVRVTWLAFVEAPAEVGRKRQASLIRAVTELNSNTGTERMMPPVRAFDRSSDINRLRPAPAGVPSHPR